VHHNRGTPGAREMASARGQKPGSQDAQLHAAGCAKVYAETRTDRPELGKVLRRLQADDVLVVTRLDRLARSTRQITRAALRV
jgi:DNA invertase Pin-like site-specific DNA recombinase